LAMYTQAHGLISNVRQGSGAIMAMITRTRDGEVIFNVSHSVGRFGRNRTGDVQLIQFLLNKIIDKWKKEGHPAPDQLSIDGICGPKTIGAILWFQKDLDPTGLMGADATVNHADEAFYFLSQYKLYTIWQMNNWLSAWKLIPKTTDVVIQPLRSELDKYATMGAPKMR
jgi:hypothetical protein